MASHPGTTPGSSATNYPGVVSASPTASLRLSIALAKPIQDLRQLSQRRDGERRSHVFDGSFAARTNDQDRRHPERGAAHEVNPGVVADHDGLARVAAQKLEGPTIDARCRLPFA